MDAATMMKTATILLALTAVGGLLMAIIRFAGADRPPSWIAMAHGLLAGSGLTLLLYAGLTAGMATAGWIGVLLLAAAALGGVYLNLAFHARLLAIPKTIVAAHALLAVAGVPLTARGPRCSSRRNRSPSWFSSRRDCSRRRTTSRYKVSGRGPWRAAKSRWAACRSRSASRRAWSTSCSCA